MAHQNQAGQLPEDRDTKTEKETIVFQKFEKDKCQVEN